MRSKLLRRSGCRSTRCSGCYYRCSCTRSILGGTSICICSSNAGNNDSSIVVIVARTVLPVVVIVFAVIYICIYRERERDK